MVTYVCFYLLTALTTMAAVSLIASKLRSLHEMPAAAVSRLALLAGVTWPLLVIAIAQAIVLLALKTALRAFGSRPGPALEAEPTDVTASMVSLAAA